MDELLAAIRNHRSAVIAAAAAVGVCAFSVLLAPWPITAVDGDTVSRMGIVHRLAGFDAPEIAGAKCPAERALAVKAQARLSELIEDAETVELIGTRAGDGTASARLEINGADVASIAEIEGWGAAYSGRGPLHDWCNAYN